jgi:hypothetical protein
MHIQWRDALIDCPPEVVNLALELHLELRRTYPYVIELLTGAEKTLWAEVDGKPAGVFMWTVHDFGRRWWVDFAAVAAEHRGKRVFVTLRDAFRELFNADPLARCYESHVKLTNGVMRELNERGGSRAVSVKYRYDKGQAAPPKILQRPSPLPGWAIDGG